MGKIVKNLTWGGAKLSYFFFTRKSSLAIHSFKSENRVFFFFRKRGKKKKTSWFFDFSRKFPENFLFFFFVAEKFVGHSFIRFQNCFFFFSGHRKKKNSIFIHSFDFPPKVHKNELFRGKKKIRYLCYNSFKKHIYL